jgi:hypothetical protein
MNGAPGQCVGFFRMPERGTRATSRDEPLTSAFGQTGH